MRYCPVTAVLFVAAWVALAADDVKPNTLTPKEVAEGWLLLFDGETTFGWKIDGEAKVDQGALVLGGDRETTATVTTAFGYCELRFRVDFDHPRGELILNEFKHPIDGWHFLKKPVNWTQIVAKVEPGAITYTMPEHPGKAGKPGFKLTKPTTVAFRVPAGKKLILRDLKLKPLETQSLFNGKDLAGWKKYEGDKKRIASEFAVTKDGWLTIKNGPGDLRTEGQWADFVLQLDCKTNGKHLNSGVFFRCRPGEYQQGYEAQIHNNFTADPPREYAVEVYDPQTNKLTGKEMLKSSAVDFGTGAIYRRIPARKAMSKDNEWLTMTVVAQGRHFATWVNGVQVVDWTDNRPLVGPNPKDSARSGCYLEKGPISLQGHDPTTDLSFRNFRIAELPKTEEKK
jgi:hypothetical protein